MQNIIALMNHILYFNCMKNKNTVDKLKKHLLEKRNELIWSLAVQQEYSFADVARIMNIKHVSTVMRIVGRKPTNWVSPWKKIIE